MVHIIGVRIVRVTRSNASILHSIAPEVFDEPIDAGRLACYLDSPEHLMLVALFGDCVVGQATGIVQRHPDKHSELFVDEIGVAPDFRKKGVARKMLRELLATGEVMGCEEAWVLTEAGNVAARKLYETASTSATTVVMYSYRLSGGSPD